MKKHTIILMAEWIFKPGKKTPVDLLNNLNLAPGKETC